MPEKRGRDNWHYRKATARLRRTAPPYCWICTEQGKPADEAYIDRALDYRHPMSWTADHVDPLSLGGKLLGPMRPAHRACNSARGNGTAQAHVQTPTSRDW